jgi:predicted metal-dependent phosphoesterase TrpH
VYGQSRPSHPAEYATLTAFAFADLHTHTSFSDGRPAPREVVQRADELGLAAVAITDHDRIDGARIAAEYATSRCAVIVGEEISSAEGHILGLFLETAVPPGLSAAATIERIHEQAGIAIAAHPFSTLGGAQGVRERGRTLGWNAIEVENGYPLTGSANRRAREENPRWCSSETGGSDAHILAAVGRVATRFPGHTVDDLRAALLAGTTVAVRRSNSIVVDAATLIWSLRRRYARILFLPRNIY